MKIELLVGMIGSGKSTYARAQARNNSMIVCHDDLVTTLNGVYAYHHSFRGFYRDVEEALLGEIARGRHDAVIDRTHLTGESRKRWLDYIRTDRFRQASREPAELVAVVFRFEAPEVHARRRFEADRRGRSYEEWLEVASRHYEQAIESSVERQEGFHGIEWKEFADGRIRDSSRDRVMENLDRARKEHNDTLRVALGDRG